MVNRWGLVGALGLWLWASPVGAIEARTIQGELTTDDEQAGDKFVDLYEFSGQAGDKVAIELTSQDFDTFITLFDSTPTLLARDDDSGGGTNSLLVFKLPKTGRYVIAVSSTLPNQLGRYELSWRSATIADEGRIEASQLNRQAIQLYRSSRFREAISILQQVTELYRSAGDRAGEGITLNNIGSVYESLGEYSQALEQFRQALTIRKEVGDRAGEGTTLYEIGLVYYRLSEYSQALDYYNQALTLFREVDDRASEGTTLNDIGGVYALLGEYPQALEQFRQALAIRREVNDRAGEGTTFHNIGAVYKSLGEYPQALEQFRQALAIAQEVGDRAGEGTALHNIGSVHDSLGEYPQALEQFRQALAIAQEVGDRAGEGTTLHNIGSVHDSLGEYPQALEQYRQALAIFQAVGDRAGEGTTLNSIGSVYDSLGQYPQALNQYQQALALRQAVGDRAGEGVTLNNIGITLSAQQKPIAAISLFKQSVNVYESIRQNNLALSLEQQKVYTESVSSTYRELANLLLTEGRLLEAQEVLELLTLQEISDYNRGTRATVNDRGELEYTPLEAQIIAAHGSLIEFDRKVLECERTECPEKATLIAQRTAANREFQTTVEQAQLKSQAAQRNDESTEDPTLLARKAAPILQQQPGTVLIQTFIQNAEEADNDKGKLWLLWIAGDTTNKIEIPIDYVDFAITVREFRDALNDRHSDPARLQQLGKKLYGWIIAPLETELQQNQIQHLIFRLDRELRYIPLAALHDGNQYLIERYTVANILTIATTDTRDRRSPTPNGDRILALGKSEPYGGFDPLPHVKDEIAAIVHNPTQGHSGPYPGDGYLDREFTQATLENNLFGRRLLHIATHGKFSPTNASNSFLLLGDNQQLSIADIHALSNLNDLHLVVLSACQTALSGDPVGDYPNQPDGRELNSLTYAFTAQGGAKAILASLWDVNDRSTSDLMQNFYRRMAADPSLTKAEALRQAQLAFLRGELTQPSDDIPNPAHPYYWSPFVLTGNSW